MCFAVLGRVCGQVAGGGRTAGLCGIEPAATASSLRPETPRPTKWRGERRIDVASRVHTVTITAVEDGAAWERLALRTNVEAKLLVPLPWSPLHDMSLAEVPSDGREHELTLYLEDTMWPYQDKLR